MIFVIKYLRLANLFLSHMPCQVKISFTTMCEMFVESNAQNLTGAFT